MDSWGPFKVSFPGMVVSAVCAAGGREATPCAGAHARRMSTVAQHCAGHVLLLPVSPPEGCAISFAVRSSWENRKELWVLEPGGIP